MRSKKISFTSTQLNTHLDIQSDIIMTDVISGSIESRVDTLMPTRLYVKNASGDTINFTILSSGEVAEYAVDTSKFAQIPMESDDVIVPQDWNLPSAYKLVVKGTGTHSASIDFIFMNYDIFV